MAHVALISIYDEYCIGLRHVADYLKQNGHEVTIIHFKRYENRIADAEIREPTDQYVTMVTPLAELLLNYAVPYSQKEMELLLELLAGRKASMVGISVPSHHKKTAFEITKAVKDHLRLPIVWGGVHPTIAPDDCFDAEGVVAALCIGDGEITFKEFVEASQQKLDFGVAPIRGMWLRVNGRIMRNEPRPVESNLDSLGMQFFDEDAEFMIDQDRVIHKEPLSGSNIGHRYKVITARGCPFSCSFCIHSTIKKRYGDMHRVRRRSPRHVIDELLSAKRRMPHLTMIEFEDDVFTLQRAWLSQFAEIYKREIALPFWCYTHPICVNSENLETLKTMGIQYITMGIQSGSDRINNEIYDRRTPKSRILEAVRLIGESGIPALYDIICCNPYETEDDLRQTLDVITRIPAEYLLQIGKLAFLPRTTLTENAERDRMIGVLDESLHRFWIGLYLVASYRIVDRDTMMQMPEDKFLRDHSKILWDIARHAELARLEHLENAQTENRSIVLQEKLKAIEAEYTGFKSRRAVRFAAQVADALRKIARIFSRNRPAPDSHP